MKCTGVKKGGDGLIPVVEGSSLAHTTDSVLEHSRDWGHKLAPRCHLVDKEKKKKKEGAVRWH